MRVGADPNKHTMSEIIAIGKAYNKQQTEQFKQQRMLGTVLAYEIAAMQRAKRLPNLQELLHKIDEQFSDEKPELSPDELLRKIVSISARNGWDVPKEAMEYGCKRPDN